MASRTTYRVVGVVMALVFVGWGVCPAQSQKPRERPAPAPLLPAEQAWLVTLPAKPSAPGAMDAHRVFIPVSGVRNDAAQAPIEQLLALDRDTGATRWVAEIETSWAPAIAHDALIVAASDEVHAFDLLTGAHRWRVPVVRPVAAPPVVVGSLALVPMAPDGVLAFHVADGSIVWQQSFGGSAGPMAWTVKGGDMLLSLPGSRIVRASTADGRVVWERTLAGVLGQPALGRDRVFVGSTDNHLYALDLDDGDVEWVFAAGGDVLGAAADENTAYFTALDNVLRALNLGNGNQRWKQVLTTRPHAPPVVLGGLVVVHGLSPALTTFTTDTGTVVGTYDAPPPSELVGPALIDSALRPFAVAIVAITGDGRAIGLRPTGMLFREAAPVPLTALPGRVLPREAQP